jgi:hypothetical protein
MDYNSERADQGDGWNGNFAPGSRLLATSSSFGGEVLDVFGNEFVKGGVLSVSGFGFQIQSSDLGPFVAFVAPFQYAGGGLTGIPGSVLEVVGNSTTSGDGSAIYVGMVDSTAEIAGFVVEVETASHEFDNFAIGQLDIVTGTSASVPEPSPFVMSSVLLGMFGAFWSYKGRIAAANATKFQVVTSFRRTGDCNGAR